MLQPRRRPSGRIHDTRVAGLIAGVANHEARQFFDARVERARNALRMGNETALADQLLEAVQLQWWRARSITSFEAFAQDVIGIDPERAHELAKLAASARESPLECLPDFAVALWMRSELALLEHCPNAGVRVEVHGDNVRLGLDVPLSQPAQAAEAVAAVGRSAAGLARILAERPRAKP